MDQAGAIRSGEELDWQNLENYVRANITDLQGDFSVAQFHGGHANLTYLIKFGDRELILRRPPFGKLAPGSHSMKREYRVLSELYQYFPQAPRAFLVCDDHDIIGSDFIIMQRRHGIVIRKEMPEAFTKFENVHERVTSAMVKTMVALHSVNVEKNNLSHLGRPENFLERQLEGWKKRTAVSLTDNDEVYEKLIQALSKNIPKTQRISIIHNDIKLDNCQFQIDMPDEVSSLFDWDMTTLGDPLLDLGSTLGFWSDAEFNKTNGIPIFLSSSFPSKAFIKEEYKKYSGLDMSRFDWYEAFGIWKAAIILQQLYKRYHDGETTDERMKYLGNASKALARLALEVLD